jgi:hypothetical protein
MFWIVKRWNSVLVVLYVLLEASHSKRVRYSKDMGHQKWQDCVFYCCNSWNPRNVEGNNFSLCCLLLHLSGSYGQDLHILTQIQNFLDANLDVPGNVDLAHNTVALSVHTTLPDGLDLRVEKVSQCKAIISCSLLHALFFTHNLFSVSCRTRLFFNFAKSLQSQI